MPYPNFTIPEVDDTWQSELQNRLASGPDFEALDALKTPDYSAADQQYAETMKLRDRLLKESVELKERAAGIEYEKPKLREKVLMALSASMMAYASNNPGATGAQLVQQMREVELMKQERVDRLRQDLTDRADVKTQQAIKISQALGDEYGERAAKVADLWNSGALQMITNDQREASEIVRTLAGFEHDQARQLLDAQVQYSLEEFRQQGYMERLRSEYELRGELSEVEFERALEGAYRDKLMGKMVSYGLIGPQYKSLVAKMASGQTLGAAELSALDVFSIMDRNARELDIDTAKQKTIMELVGRDRPVLDENGNPRMDIRKDKILTQPITYEEALGLFQAATKSSESKYRESFGMEASTATEPTPPELQDPRFQSTHANELVGRAIGAVGRMISEGTDPKTAIDTVVERFEAKGIAPEIVHQFQERVLEELDLEAAAQTGQPVPELTERGLTQHAEAVIQRYAQNTGEPLADVMAMVQEEVSQMDPLAAEQYIQDKFGHKAGRVSDFIARFPATTRN